MRIEINKELSEKLIAEYGLLKNECYNNVYELLTRHYEVDTMCIGYVKLTTLPFLVRHGWGLVDGEIIETNLDTDTIVEYYPLHTLTVDDWIYIATHYKNMFTGLGNYKMDEELTFLDTLLDTGVIDYEQRKGTICMCNTQLTSYVLMNEKLREKYFK